MMGFTQQAAEDERKLIQKELDAAKARDRELDLPLVRLVLLEQPLRFGEGDAVQ